MQIEDTESIKQELAGKCVMITGAAGSIGSEIARQISCFNPGLLLLCDIAESPLYQLALELKDQFPTLSFRPIICNVRDFNRMEKILTTYRPQYIYHAAAYKHVPLMEKQPSEAVLTNVLGTKNLADLALRNHAEVFVMISTDKAVNPSNIMGASKRLAEIYIQSLEGQPTRFITTRFGNVIGSNGSVIPLFKDQIAKGGPVTVTHPDIIRFFMTISEACSLVLKAGDIGKGGEIFIFDMGDPVKILDLAEDMIREAGHIPYDDIQIQFTGLRPGEKLYEELLNREEHAQPTHHKKILVGTVRKYDHQRITTDLESLFTAAEKYNEEEVVILMKKLLPEFISHNSEYESLD